MRKYPDKILREKCQPVEEITSTEKDIFINMLFTMKYFRGIGLAAPQVGILRNLIVIDIGEGIIKLANPKVIKKKGEKEMEGCLSIPGTGVSVKRSYEIGVEALNQEGKLIEVKAKGLLARVLQHKIDYLEGKLIVDYLPFLEKIKFRLREEIDNS
ncbi:MAG: peptide deformylase [Candidatus Omnitrophica bacterium]|nr:peptide deformylase [Candidatus Omnitrophota bacterium]